MKTIQIENVLRGAPRPQPPAGLKARLQNQAPAYGRSRRAGAGSSGSGIGSWLARWWPALAPAAISLACAAVLGVQQQELRELKNAASAAGNAATMARTASPPNPGAAAPKTLSPAEESELATLKSQAQKLASEIAQLERTRSENQRLRAQLASAPGTTLTAEETKAIEAARDKALAITCVNQLKQLGLAVRIYANDNGDKNPPNLISLANYLSTPKLMVCPADTGRQPAPDWPSFSPANCSYEYLAPSADETEPQRILFRCPFHGSIGLCDGSVQLGIAKNRPDLILQRDGKLYFQQSEISIEIVKPETGSNNPGQ